LGVKEGDVEGEGKPGETKAGDGIDLKTGAGCKSLPGSSSWRSNTIGLEMFFLFPYFILFIIIFLWRTKTRVVTVVSKYDSAKIPFFGFSIFRF
jgi:hypothetical protein